MSEPENPDSTSSKNVENESLPNPPINGSQDVNNTDLDNQQDLIVDPLDEQLDEPPIDHLSDSSQDDVNNKAEEKTNPLNAKGLEDLSAHSQLGKGILQDLSFEFFATIITAFIGTLLGFTAFGECF